MLAGAHAYIHTYTHTHMYTACRLDDFKTVIDFLPTPSILVSVQQRRTCDGCSPPQGAQLCCGKEKKSPNFILCYFFRHCLLSVLVFVVVCFVFLFESTWSWTSILNVMFFSDVVTLLELWRVLDLYTDAGPPEPEPRACWWQVIAHNTDLHSIYEFTDLNVLSSFPLSTLIFISSQLNSKYSCVHFHFNFYWQLFELPSPVCLDRPACNTVMVISWATAIHARIFVATVKQSNPILDPGTNGCQKGFARKGSSENENSYAYSFQLDKKMWFREWEWLCLFLSTEQEKAVQRMKMAMPTPFDWTRIVNKREKQNSCANFCFCFAVCR